MRQPSTRSAPSPRKSVSMAGPQRGTQSSPMHPRQQAIMSSRMLALPHSSGDTVMDDVVVQPELVYEVPNNGSGSGSGSHLPVRSTPNGAPISPAPTSSIGGEDSLEILGSTVKVLLHAIRDLERHGIDAAASVPLPKIVVVGDQSAGKSSLIEAISDITVPRDSGTCTRCVLHINLRDEPQSQWRCDVSLVNRYAYLDENTDAPLHPWTETDQSIIPLATVHEKGDLESIIRRAQLATLNPATNPRDFMKPRINMSAPTQASFSPNIISLEITAPGLPDLSFYDLPGIISQSHDGRKETVDLIHHLARTYIEQENTIILLAVPMESDIDNSMASALIDRTVGAAERTIGVLTKPDRLQSDDRVDVWKSVLDGQKFRKGHGYFVVKQPSQAELNAGMDHAEARASEEAFFKSAAWTRRFGDLGATGRLGTRSLQRDLSNKLAQLIFEVMPELEAKVTYKHGVVEDELSELPEPPANALQVVNRAVTDFTHAFKLKIDGSEPNDLSEAWKAIKNEFHHSIIVGQRPTLYTPSPTEGNSSSPAPSKSKPSKAWKRAKEVIDLSSDEDEALSPKKKYKSIESTPKKHDKAPKREASISSVSQVVRDPLRKTFKLLELRDTLDSFSASGLPSVVELKAVDHMMLMTLQNWNTPLNNLIRGLNTALLRSLTRTLNETVKEWRATQLFKEIHTANLQFLNTHLENMKVQVDRALRIEKVKPITRDEKLMDRYVAEETSLLETARLKTRHHEYAKEELEQCGKDIAIKTWDEKSRKLALAAIGADPFAREVSVMARIRAYYQIASMRFVDHVVQAVEAELFTTFRDGLGDELMEALHVHHEDGYKYANRLVADDADREERRAALKEKKERLEQAGERLRTMNRNFHEQNALIGFI